VNKVFIALETINLGKVIFLAYADGSIEYRDRVTMAETFNDGDLDRVWHLSQIGFSYPDDDPCKSSIFINSKSTDIVQASRWHCPPATVPLYELEMMETFTGGNLIISWVILDPAWTKVSLDAFDLALN